MNPMTCNSDGTKLSQFTQLTKNPDMLHCKNASKAMASFTSNPRLRNPELCITSWKNRRHSDRTAAKYGMCILMQLHGVCQGSTKHTHQLWGDLELLCWFQPIPMRAIVWVFDDIKIVSSSQRMIP